MRPPLLATAHRCRQCAPDRRDQPSWAGAAALCRMRPAAIAPGAEDRSSAGRLRKREPAQRSANTSIARSSLLPSNRQGLLMPSSSVRPDDPMLAFWPVEGPPKNIAKMIRADVSSSARVAALAIFFAAWAALMAVPAMSTEKGSEPEVGTTVLIKRRVTGTLGTEERVLETGFRVYRNELLRTGSDAQAELKLDDDTKLALGPNAELRLDEFVVANSNDAKSVTLRFIKGTFRFITGSNPSESYRVETPSATIGVRG